MKVEPSKEPKSIDVPQQAFHPTHHVAVTRKECDKVNARTMAPMKAGIRKARFPDSFRSWFDFPFDRSGAAAAEFALILPPMMLALFSIIKFGIVMNNDVELTSGTSASARQFAISRGNATPWTTAAQIFQQAAPNLVNVTLNVTVGVKACNSDPSCEAALSIAEGETVAVSATYPCDLTILGINFAPNCQLSSSTLQVVE